jgi:hypothetical protein
VITCGDASVGYLDNGTAGDPGAPGRNGLDYCYIAASATEGVAYDVFCGEGNLVGQLRNGADGAPGPAGPAGPQGPEGPAGGEGPGGGGGTSCTVGETPDGLYFVINCGAGNSAQIAKALCGTTAYDPEKQFCVAGELLDSDSYAYCLVYSTFAAGAFSPAAGAAVPGGLLTYYDRKYSVCYNGKIYDKTDEANFRWCGGEGNIPYDKRDEFCVNDAATYDNCLSDGVVWSTSTTGEYNPETQFCGVIDCSVNAGNNNNSTLCGTTLFPGTPTPSNGIKRVILAKTAYEQCEVTKKAGLAASLDPGTKIAVASKAKQTSPAFNAQYCMSNGRANDKPACAQTVTTTSPVYDPRIQVCDGDYAISSKEGGFDLCGGGPLPTDADFSVGGKIYNENTDFCYGGDLYAKAGHEACYQKDASGNNVIVGGQPVITAIIDPSAQFCTQTGGAGAWRTCGTANTKYEWDVKYCDVDGAIKWRCGPTGTVTVNSEVLGTGAAEGSLAAGSAPTAPLSTAALLALGIYDATGSFCLNTTGNNPYTTTSPQSAPSVTSNYQVVEKCGGMLFNNTYFCFVNPVTIAGVCEGTSCATTNATGDLLAEWTTNDVTIGGETISKPAGAPTVSDLKDSIEANAALAAAYTWSINANGQLVAVTKGAPSADVFSSTALFVAKADGSTAITASGWTKTPASTAVGATNGSVLLKSYCANPPVAGATFTATTWSCSWPAPIP